MWDASGRNVTRQQVMPVDDAIPTLTIGALSAKPSAGGIATASSTVSLIAAVEKPRPASPEIPEHPSCGSISTRSAASPSARWTSSGRTLPPVASNCRLSALSARLRGPGSQHGCGPGDAQPAGQRNGHRLGHGPVHAAAPGRLAEDNASAEAIGLRETPTFVWRTAEGKEGTAYRTTLRPSSTRWGSRPMDPTSASWTWVIGLIALKDRRAGLEAFGARWASCLAVRLLHSARRL